MITFYRKYSLYCEEKQYIDTIAMLGYSISTEIDHETREEYLIAKKDENMISIYESDKWVKIAFGDGTIELICNETSENVPALSEDGLNFLIFFAFSEAQQLFDFKGTSKCYDVIQMLRDNIDLDKIESQTKVKNQLLLNVQEFQIKKTDYADLYQKALETYGKNLEVNLAIEEFSELIAELAKGMGGRKSNPSDLIKEIVDAEIMLEQLKVVYGFDYNLKFRILKKLRENLWEIDLEKRWRATKR